MFTAEGLAEQFKYPFSPQAVDMLKSAQDEARSFNHNYLGSSHLLIGLVVQNTPPLESMNVEPHQIRNKIELILGKEDRLVVGDVFLAQRAIKIIEQGVNMARISRAESLLPEHILLSLIKESEGIGCGILESLGVSLDKIQLKIELGLSE